MLFLCSHVIIINWELLLLGWISQSRPFSRCFPDFTYSPNPPLSSFFVWISVVKLHLTMFNFGILSTLIAFFRQTNRKQTKLLWSFPWYFTLKHKGLFQSFTTKNIDFVRTHALKLWYYSPHPLQTFFSSSKFLSLSFNFISAFGEYCWICEWKAANFYS